MYTCIFSQGRDWVHHYPSMSPGDKDCTGICVRQREVPLTNTQRCTWLTCYPWSRAVHKRVKRVNHFTGGSFGTVALTTNRIPPRKEKSANQVVCAIPVFLLASWCDYDGGREGCDFNEEWWRVIARTGVCGRAVEKSIPDSSTRNISWYNTVQLPKIWLRSSCPIRYIVENLHRYQKD